MAGDRDVDEMRTINAELKGHLGEVQEQLRAIVPLRTENELLARENCRALLRLKAKVEHALDLEPRE
jgi:hypothetical protein